MNKHTPGPWAIRTDWKAAPQHIVADGAVVASFLTSVRAYCGTAEIAANALLITASPDMLEALRSIAAESTGDDPDLIATIQGICRFAIAKATGDLA